MDEEQLPSVDDLIQYWLGWTDAQERSTRLREDLYTWLSNPANASPLLWLSEPARTAAFRRLFPDGLPSPTRRRCLVRDGFPNNSSWMNNVILLGGGAQ